MLKPPPVPNDFMRGWEPPDEGGIQQPDPPDPNELALTSPCPPPHMVVARATWLAAWKARRVGYAPDQCRESRLSPDIATTLKTSAKVLALCHKLPQWPVQQTAERRRSVMARAICQAAEAYEGTAGLLLLAETGSGKTVGAVHALFTLWERSFRDRVPVPRAMFVKAADLAAARRCHPLGEGEPKLLVSATEAKLLVIDDLGQDERRDNVMMDVLDARYDTGLPSVVTSGLTLKQLAERYGQALVRRIVETNGAGQIVNLFKPTLQAAGAGK